MGGAPPLAEGGGARAGVRERARAGWHTPRARCCAVAADGAQCRREDQKIRDTTTTTRDDNAQRQRATTTRDDNAR